MTKIIFLNGAACAGKSTIAKILEQRFGYRHYAIDSLLNDKLGLSQSAIDELTDVEWDELAAGFYGQAIDGATSSGKSVIVDDVLNILSWSKLAAKAFAECEMTLVGVYCPLTILRTREMQRANANEAAVHAQFYTVHRNKRYDVKVDTSCMSPEQCADKIENYELSGKKSTLAIAEKLLGNKAHLISK